MPCNSLCGYSCTIHLVCIHPIYVLNDHPIHTHMRRDTIEDHTSKVCTHIYIDLRPFALHLFCLSLQFLVVFFCVHIYIVGPSSSCVTARSGTDDQREMCMCVSRCFSRSCVMSSSCTTVSHQKFVIIYLCGVDDMMIIVARLRRSIFEMCA